MTVDIEKLLSIGTPGKKRGSHVWSHGGTTRTAVERVREYALKNPNASQKELERQVRIEACGAVNQETFARTLCDGFSEVGKIIEEKTAVVTVSERPAADSEKK